MIRDLRSILEDWDYEPGKISVRKIIGTDGTEKIQTRIDLGLLQLEPQGRPDGKRPHDANSLLEHFEQRLVEHVQRCGDDDAFTISPEECRELRHEGYLFYQRYLSLFVLEEFGGVVQDTARNLRLMDFCHKYAASEQDREALEPQRAYLLMMHTRARALNLWNSDRHATALRILERGLEDVAKILNSRGEDVDEARTEIKLMQELRDDIIADMPDDAITKLEMRLQAAVEEEDFETAADLRDKIQTLTSTSSDDDPGYGD